MELGPLTILPESVRAMKCLHSPVSAFSLHIDYVGVNVSEAHVPGFNMSFESRTSWSFKDGFFFFHFKGM